MLLAGQSANWLDTVANIELGTFTEMKEDGYSFLSRKYSPLPQSSLVYMYLTAEHDNPWWSLCLEWVCLSLHRVNSNSSVNTQVSCCGFKLVLTFNLYWGLVYLAVSMFIMLWCNFSFVVNLQEWKVRENRDIVCSFHLLYPQDVEKFMTQRLYINICWMSNF